MRIVDQKAIDLCRSRAAGICEFSRRHATEGGHVHHLFGKGFGGADRLDIAVNLIFLSATVHRMVHDGHVSREALLEIVAAREHTTAAAIIDEVQKIRRRP